MGKIKNNKFAQAQKKHDELVKEAELAKNFSGEFKGEKIKYFGLEDGVEKVFRIIGAPFIVREEGYDPKIILQSEILRDDKKGYIRVNWPVVTKNGKFVPDPDWILTRLYEAVTAGEWKKLPEGETNEWGNDFYKEHTHQGTDVYARVMTNKKPKDRSFKKNFYPGKRIVMNVIDRHDKWCKKEKHSKVLSSGIGVKEYEDQEGKVEVREFPQIGIPYKLYQKIYNYFNRIHGDWNVDAIVTKISDQKDYEVFDATERRHVSAEALNLASEAPLTSKEEEYELYDLDQIFKDCSYQKLYKHLKGLFTLCDAELGTNFEEELRKLAEKEKEEYKKNQVEEDDDDEDIEDIEEDDVDVDDEGINDAEDDDTPPWKDEDDDEEEEEIDDDDDDDDDEEEEIEEAPKKKRRTRAKKEEEVVDPDSELKKHFPHWDDLTDDEQAIMRKFVKKFKDGVPIYSSKADEVMCPDETCVYPGTDVETEFPSDVYTCPVCGIEDDEE